MNRLISLLLVLSLFYQQSGFAQLVPQSPTVYFYPPSLPLDSFRPLHLRCLDFSPADQGPRFVLDKGDVKDITPENLRSSSKKLMDYFFIGLSLPNESFWVNLRPDQPDKMIEPYLERTDMGKVLLEADLNLKKDLSRFTSMRTAEGKLYWNKLYVKAAELFGNEQAVLPTYTRPWIVPDEIVLRQSINNAYIYKATLKVCLEQDHLAGSAPVFDDTRLKELNNYSAQLIRQLVLPKLTQAVNSSKRYAELRQVYYSLILAQWFKNKVKNGSRFSVLGYRLSEKNRGMKDDLPGTLKRYIDKIDSKDLSNLTSKQSWSKNTYFNQYKQSFQKGEYDETEVFNTSYGQSIRQYKSGGINFSFAAGLMDGGGGVRVINTTKVLPPASDLGQVFVDIQTEEIINPAGAVILNPQLSDYLAQQGNHTGDMQKAAQLLNSKQVLWEIGSGHNQAAIAIAAKNPDMGVIATDIYNKESSISFYREYGEEWETGRLPGQQAYMENLSLLKSEVEVLKYLPDNSLDYILLVNPEDSVAVELAGLIKNSGALNKLKPGGQIIIRSYWWGIDYYDNLFAGGARFQRHDTRILNVDLSGLSEYSGNNELYIFTKNVAGGKEAASISQHTASLVEARELNKKQLLYKKLIKENDHRRWGLVAKLLGIVPEQTADSIYRLLHPFYVAHDLAVKKQINPQSRAANALYYGAGVDISNFLLSTNAAHGDFISYYNNAITVADLEKLKHFDRNNYSKEELLRQDDYLKWKSKQGYGAVKRLEKKEDIIVNLALELLALGVNLSELSVGKDPIRGCPEINFDWAYPGERSRKYSISFIDKSVIEGPEYLYGTYDIYYQRAGMGIPFEYRPVEGQPSFLLKVYEHMSPGGYFVTDDHGIKVSMHDLSEEFPLSFPLIPVAVEPALREAIIALRSLSSPYTKNIAIWEYGWDVLIRQVPWDKPVINPDGGGSSASLGQEHFQQRLRSWEAIAAIDNKLLSANPYARSLSKKINLSSKHIHSMGKGVVDYIQYRKLKAYGYLMTKDIVPGEDLPAGYPVTTGLREPRASLRKSPGSINDIPKVDVVLPGIDIFLVSKVHNGARACVKLGFLPNGEPVALKVYSSPYGASYSLEKGLFESYQSGMIAEDLGIGPRMHGFFKDNNGLLWMVMDLVPGDFAAKAEEFVTGTTINELVEIGRRVKAVGLSMEDFQYYVTPNGHVVVIDTYFKPTGKSVVRNPDGGGSSASLGLQDEKISPRIAAAENELWADNLYSRSLYRKINFRNKNLSFLWEGTAISGLSDYLEYQKPAAYGYLMTKDIVPAEDLPPGYPVASGLRQPSALFSKPPRAIAEAPKIDVVLPDYDVFLTSHEYNGSVGCVKLGFLLNGDPVALKTYFLDNDKESYWQRKLLKSYNAGLILDDLGIGPRMHGFFKDKKGMLWMVMDLVPGEFTEKAGEFITVGTVNELIEINNRLKAAGLLTNDFQYYITPDGHIVVIDTYFTDSGGAGIKDFPQEMEELLKYANDGVKSRFPEFLRPISDKITGVDIKDGGGKKISGLQEPAIKAYSPFVRSYFSEYRRILAAHMNERLLYNSQELEKASTDNYLSLLRGLTAILESDGSPVTYIYPLSGIDMVPAVVRPTYLLNKDTVDYERGKKLLERVFAGREFPSLYANLKYNGSDAGNLEYYRQIRRMTKGKCVLLLKGFSGFGNELQPKPQELLRSIFTEVLREGDAVVVLDKYDAEMAKNIASESGFSPLAGKMYTSPSLRRIRLEEFQKIFIVPDAVLVLEKTGGINADGGRSKGFEIVNKNARLDRDKDEERRRAFFNLPKTENKALSGNRYFKSLLGKIGSQANDIKLLGKGVSDYINARGLTRYGYLMTYDIIPQEDLPENYPLLYDSGKPRQIMRKIPANIEDVVKIEVILPDIDTFLASNYHNGSGGCVKLAFLTSGEPVAIKTYFSEYGSKDSLEKELLKSYQSAQIADDLRIGPRVHGFYTDIYGILWMVMDIVPGDFEPVAREMITVHTIEDLFEIHERIKAAKLSTDDFQYYVTPKGHIVVIDTYFDEDAGDPGIAKVEEVFEELLEYVDEAVLLRALPYVQEFYPQFSEDMKKAIEEKSNIVVDGTLNLYDAALINKGLNDLGLSDYELQGAFERAAYVNSRNENYPEDSLEFILRAIEIYFNDKPMNDLVRMQSLAHFVFNSPGMRNRKQQAVIEKILQETAGNIRASMKNKPPVYDGNNRQEMFNYIKEVLSLNDSHLSVANLLVRTMLEQAADIRILKELAMDYEKRVTGFFDELRERLSGIDGGKYSLALLSERDKKGGVGQTKERSPLASDKRLGGIDLRNLPVSIQPIHSGATVPRPAGSIASISSAELDSKWEQIQALLAKGAVPSVKEISAYLSWACASGADSRKLDAALSCLAQIMRLEELYALPCEPGFLEMLALLESGNPQKELAGDFFRLSR